MQLQLIEKTNAAITEGMMKLDNTHVYSLKFFR